MNKAVKWTDREIEILEDRFPFANRIELQYLFPYRTMKSIEGKAERMKLKKLGDSKMVYWKENELDVLRSEYVESSEGDFKKLLPNKDWAQIQQKASRLGIRKYNKNKENRKEKKVWSSEGEIREYVESKGHILLSVYFENNKRYIDILTEKGIERTYPLTKYVSYEGIIPYKIHYYENAVEHINEEGYILQTSKTDYISGTQQLDLICPNNHHWECDFTRFYSGVRCVKCFHEKKGKQSMLSKSVIISIINNKGGNFLSFIDYNGYNSKVSLTCEIHYKQGEQVELFSNINQRSSACLYCCYQSRSGENHPLWKCGITDITRWSRGRVSRWVQDILNKNDNTCEITGDKENVVVHHKYPFHKILEESLSIEKLNIREDIAKYTQEELNSLKYTLNKLHYEKDIGVCISEDIHKLFHGIYSYKDFTVDNYYEFKKRYNDGEFNELLGERGVIMSE